MHGIHIASTLPLMHKGYEHVGLWCTSLATTLTWLRIAFPQYQPLLGYASNMQHQQGSNEAPRSPHAWNPHCQNTSTGEKGL